MVLKRQAQDEYWRRFDGKGKQDKLCIQMTVPGDSYHHIGFWRTCETKPTLQGAPTVYCEATLV